MKIYRHLIPVLSLLLLLLVIPAISGCSHKDRSDAKEVVKSELDQLKNPDAKTVQKYISYKDLFPDATENTRLSNEIKEVFSLFFQKFDYKILDISVDNEKKLPRHPCGLLRLMPRLLLRILPLPCYRQKLLRLLRHSQEIPKILPILWKVIT